MAKSRNSSIGIPNNANITTSSSSNPPMVGNVRKKQYKGVRMRSWGSWVSEIRAPNQKTRIWLGSYSTPEAAARAYDAALLCLKGPSAALNFPDSPPLHLPGTLLSPKSIQRIAAAAAAAATATATATTTSSPSPSPSPSVSSDPAEDDPLALNSRSGFTSLMEEESLSEQIPTEPWVDFGAFQSPKCMDQLLDHWAFVPPPLQAEECDDYEGDIRLWSFY